LYFNEKRIEGRDRKAQERQERFALEMRALKLREKMLEEGLRPAPVFSGQENDHDFKRRMEDRGREIQNMAREKEALARQAKILDERSADRRAREHAAKAARDLSGRLDGGFGPSPTGFFDGSRTRPSYDSDLYRRRRRDSTGYYPRD
jgi:hypothetical protein